MFGVCGDDNPNWKGGCTPDRQSFYVTKEWKKASKFVRNRDKACQRCGAAGVLLEIHHIVGFACIELRSEVTNLVCLCESCHDFVHSKKNKKREFIANADGERG